MSTDNLAHNHNDNYFVINSNMTYCSCRLLSHAHDYRYTTYDSSQHYRNCICQLVPTLSNHFFTHSFWQNGNEYSECGGCGYCKISTGTIMPGI